HSQHVHISHCIAHIVVDSLSFSHCLFWSCWSAFVFVVCDDQHLLNDKTHPTQGHGNLTHQIDVVMHWLTPTHKGKKERKKMNSSSSKIHTPFPTPHTQKKSSKNIKFHIIPTQHMTRHDKNHMTTH